jgi:hypothetical protein
MRRDPSTLVGGYARAFDLVSTEYGWTDEVIGELPLARFRQITAAIEQRKYIEQRQAQSVVSWQTRTLAQFIAAGYMTDGENPAIDAAGQLALDEIEREMIAEAQEQAEVGPKKPDDFWTPDMPSESKVNDRGSFERFRASMR